MLTYFFSKSDICEWNWFTGTQLLKGPFGARKSSQTPKIISTLRGLKVGTVFGGSRDCVAPNSPIVQIIPQPAGRLPNSAAKPYKPLSGLKLTCTLHNHNQLRPGLHAGSPG